MEEKVVRKTTVRRTTRKSVAPEKVAPRPRAVRKTAESSPVRKAPTRSVVSTPAAASVYPSRSNKRTKALLIGLPLFLVLLGVSALIGMTDKGELDVASAITQRKQNASSDEEKQALESVPTEQIKPSAPNGGLVGMGAPAPTPVTPEPAASSTDQSASSTPEATEGEQDTPDSESSAQEPPAAETEASEPQATENASTETLDA